MTAFIRGLEPEGIVVSVGAEIGEVGMKNSTVEELHAFMTGYNRTLAAKGTIEGISKISVQTGTSHGGVVLADGSIAEVKLDLQALAALSETARSVYGLAGAVQHGASTLPPTRIRQLSRASRPPKSTSPRISRTSCSTTPSSPPSFATGCAPG